MSRVFFASELEGVATFWRIHRSDGVTLGFVSHDRDLWFDGVLHRAAPGMVPSAIRRSAGLTGDSAEMQGPLAHDAIAASDLAAGRYDEAQIEAGAVDWETLDRVTLYTGAIGAVSQEGAQFSAELKSVKAALAVDPVPRTSPICRAVFCGPECGLNPAPRTHDGQLAALDIDAGCVTFAGIDAAALVGGSVRWLDGPHAGLTMAVAAVAGAGALVLDAALDRALAPGARARLREGCDHTLATCHARFGNAVNFRGEPFLPGNDLLTRYPAPA